MAGDWIKIQTDLANKPEVISMAATLQLEEDFIVGKLVKLWGWADQQSRNGHASVTLAWINRHVNVTGFAEAMIKVGWLCQDGDNGIQFPNFERHNGTSAKQRITATARQRAHRANLSRNRHIKSMTREEKRREEKKKEIKKEKLSRTPEQFIADLQAEPAYERMNVRHEYDKATVWCKTNGRQLTERFFVNWLARADKPIGGAKQQGKFVC